MVDDEFVMVPAGEEYIGDDVPDDDEQSGRTGKDDGSEALVFSRANAGGDDAQGPSLWLITFTDIMALMLTFFVLLYTMSVPEVEQWEEVVSSVNEGFSKFYSPENYAGPQDTISIDKIDKSEALNLQYLKSLLQAKIDKNDILRGTIVEFQGKDRLIVSMPNNLLFESSRDAMTVDGLRAVFMLAEVFNRLDNRLEIVGHSDPRPFAKSANATKDQQGWSSNWELSLARALSVSRALYRSGYGRDIVTHGVSSARYDELPAVLGEEARLNFSRRVDIVIMKDDGNIRKFMQFN